MKHEYENARRHAHNTLAEVNRHLDKGNIKNPRHHQMLVDMAEKATRTLNNLDAMDDARPYSDTNIGYNADMRRRRYSRDDANDAIKDTMEAIKRILPNVSDDFDDDMDMRQGVPGTGPYANPRLRRRGGRKGIGRRRAEVDDTDEEYDADDRYDDGRYDDVDARRGGRRRRDSRGRFARSDDRYEDDTRYDAYPTTDHERRMHDAITRTAADTARRMVDDRRSDDIYPGTPVMRENRHNVRNDMRHDTRDARNDARNDSDDAAAERSSRVGPEVRR